MKQVSNKEKINKEKLKKAYEEIDLEREHICSGCGQSQMLSHSHIISRSKRKDLEANKNNILFDCLNRVVADEFGNEGCHSRWESNDIKKMLTLKNFQERMDYLMGEDPDTWVKIHNKLCVFKFL